MKVSWIKTPFLLVAVGFLPVPTQVCATEISWPDQTIGTLKKNKMDLAERPDAANGETSDLSAMIAAAGAGSDPSENPSSSQKEMPIEHPSEEHSGLTRLVDTPKLRITGFSDLGFTSTLTDSQRQSTFFLGDVDLFITSEITDQLSFLSEAVFYAVPGSDFQAVQLERVILKYSFSDIFNVEIGRMHTPLGYWNEAFHHGVWLQTTVARPEIYLFEYEPGGGFLPVHSVGIDLSGTENLMAFALGYHLAVLNGRGEDPYDVQQYTDAINAKAIDVSLSLKPHFTEGLQAGATTYLDMIPPDPPARTKKTAERIVGGYLVYVRDRAEFLGEVFDIHHADRSSGRDFASQGFYLQASYKITQFTPYYRFDRVSFGVGDPFFASLPAVDNSRHTMGMKWDVLSWSALKLEYALATLKASPNQHTITADVSFVF